MTWASAYTYTVAVLPLAVAGLLDPMLAGAARAFSSVFAVSTSPRLRRFRAANGSASTSNRPGGGADAAGSTPRETTAAR